MRTRVFDQCALCWCGKELNWHFDNSEFAITLLLQAPEAGGVFEYVRDLRDAEAGDMNLPVSQNYSMAGC